MRRTGGGLGQTRMPDAQKTNRVDKYSEGSATHELIL